MYSLMQENNHKNKLIRVYNYALPIGCIMITLLLIARDLLGVSINKFVFVGLMVAVGVVSPYRNLVSLLTFTFPLSCGLPGTYIYLVGAVMILFKRKKISSIYQLLVPISIISYELLLNLLYDTINIVSLIGYLSRVFILFFLILDKDKDSNFDYEKSIRYFIYGSTTLLAILLISTFQELTLIDFIHSNFRIGNISEYTGIEKDTMKISNNANNIAYYAVVSSACLLMFLSKYKKNKMYWIAILIFTVYVGMLTFSRSFLIVFALIVTIFLLAIRVLRLNNYKFLIGFIGVCTLAAFFFYMNPDFLDRYIMRFNEASISARSIIFKKYADYLLENPLQLLFGVGAVSYQHIIIISNAVHNGIQQILVAYGIVGFFLFSGALISSVFYGIRNKKRQSLINYLPLIAVVVFVQTIQFLNPYELMMPFIIGIYAIRCSI